MEWKKNEDVALEIQNDKHINEISREIANSNMNKNIKTIDDAFMQLMNYEVYQQAIDYKKREADESKKKSQIEVDETTQKKIEEKREVISQLRQETIEKEEQLQNYIKDAEQLAKDCSGKLENLPLYRNNLEYFIFLFINS